MPDIEDANMRCPRCGSPLITDGERVWCTFVGGRESKTASSPACTYGIDTAIQYLPAAIKARTEG